MAGIGWWIYLIACAEGFLELDWACIVAIALEAVADYVPTCLLGFIIEVYEAALP